MSTVDRAWAKRNLGYDPGAEQPPAAAFAFAAARNPQSDQDIQRDIIDFDSEAPEGAAVDALAATGSTGLSKFTDIAWPAGLAPQPAPTMPEPDGAPLPKADVLVVTWTMDEGHALSRVLTPGKDSKNDWKPYTHNFATLKADFRADSPALEAARLGTYWMTTIDKKKVLCFKSDSHMSQDGPKFPNPLVWKQIIAETGAKLVLTTGTGGGIGSQFEVGDVIVSRYVRFDTERDFKKYNDDEYDSAAVKNSRFATAQQLFTYNAKQLPADNNREPNIVVSAGYDSGVATTDFFGFDNTADTYHLQGVSDLSEMGDAVLGMVCKAMEKPPQWQCVRNVSDPQIDSDGMTLAQQTTFASSIYKRYGRWSSVCSAIVCWAIIVDSP